MCDLAIIGGGPAGYSAAYEAVRYGLSVLLFENRDIGGTCLNRGCVPTKYLNHAARLYSDIKRGQRDGILCEKVSFDPILSHARMKEIVLSQQSSIVEMFETAGIQYICGEAVLLDPETIECNGRVFSARNILIATGSKQHSPIIDGAITSDELLELNYVPQKLSIFGGGTVAVEFANIFSLLGSEVEIYIRGERILRKWDKEIAVGVTQSFKRRGIIINKGVDFKSITLPEGVVLSAVGRTPTLPEGADKLVDIQDGIVVDNIGRTRTSGVYAAGDVIQGSSQLAHIAMEQGRRVARDIAGIKQNDLSHVVRCIYLSQEIATVGYDELAANKDGIDTISAKANMFSNARSMISTDERGFIKIVADKTNGMIIGAQLMCERAGDIITELETAINQQMTVNELLMTVRPHPSYSEAVTDVLINMQLKL